MRKGGEPRVGDDACPGVLRPHLAADGALVRLRVPGGVLAASTLRALAVAAQEFGDGRIGLTSRGNVQVRGVREGDVGALARRLRAVGLLAPAEHDQHEHVRNIIASPLSGRTAGSLDDVDGLAGDLDAAVRARPGLVALSGRFLFALDDGSEDVAGEHADLRAVALGGGNFKVGPSGTPGGVLVRRAGVVTALVAGAEAFLAERAEQRSKAWRIAELTDGEVHVLTRLIVSGRYSAQWSAPLEDANSEQACGRRGPAEPGLFEQRDGLSAVCAVVGLGLLEAEQAAAVAAAADLSTASPEHALRITPWRRIMLRDLHLPAALAARELLASVGLVVAPGVGWSRVTACAGRPGCAKSRTDVQQDARAFAAGCDPVGPAVHLAGCERGCGTPSGPAVVQVLATPGGYRLQGGTLSAGDAALVSEADATTYGGVR